MTDHKEGEKNQMKRELDSVDDFEHLGHDSSPLKEHGTADDLLSGFKTGLSSTARDIHNEIDKRVENVARSVTDMFDPLANVPEKMNSMGDHFKETSDYEKFLDDFNPAAPKVGVDKTSIQSFVDREREFLHDLPKQIKENVLDRYSDSEPEHDDFRPSMDDNFPKKDLGDSKKDTFKDLDDFFQGPPIQQIEQPQKPVIPQPVLPPITISHKEPVPEIPKPKTPEPVKEPVKPAPEPVKQPEPVKKQPEPVKKQPEAVKSELIKPQGKPQIAPADAGVIFRKMGLGKCSLLVI